MYEVEMAEKDNEKFIEEIFKVTNKCLETGCPNLDKKITCATCKILALVPFIKEKQRQSIEEFTKKILEDSVASVTVNYIKQVAKQYGVVFDEE